MSLNYTKQLERIAETLEAIYKLFDDHYNPVPVGPSAPPIQSKEESARIAKKWEDPICAYCQVPVPVQYRSTRTDCIIHQGCEMCTPIVTCLKCDQPVKHPSKHCSTHGTVVLNHEEQ